MSKIEQLKTSGAYAPPYLTGGVEIQTVTVKLRNMSAMRNTLLTMTAILKPFLFVRVSAIPLLLIL